MSVSSESMGLNNVPLITCSTTPSASSLTKLRVTAGTGGDMVFTVSGIFDLGNKGANQRSTFVALHTAQSLLGLQGGVSSLEVTVSDIYAAEDVAQRITARTALRQVRATLLARMEAGLPLTGTPGEGGI